MVIICDHRLPASARDILQAFLATPEQPVIFLDLRTEGIVEPSISGHPAVFFCPMPDKLVVAPDLPEKYFNLLDSLKVSYITGDKKAGGPNTDSRNIASYNALITPEYLIHDLQQTDPVILQHGHYLKKIPVKQAFTRSHLVHLAGEHFLTSDLGIEKALQERGLEVMYVSPEPILLAGHLNGGIGGVSVVAGHFFFINGRLKFLKQESQIKNFLEEISFKIIELGDYPPMDIGGFIFI